MVGDPEDSFSMSKDEVHYKSNRNSSYDDDNQRQIEQEQMENESNKSDKSDDEKMNVFGFNDDLGILDDRIII